MAMVNLIETAVSLDALREYARKELVDLLNEMRGGKVLVIDPQFAGPLGLVTEIQLLKDHAVEQLYYLEHSVDSVRTDCSNIIFMVRPHLDLMQAISTVIEGHKQRRQEKQYAVIFVPLRTVICEHVLEEQGLLLPNLTLHDYKLDLIPFDSDLLSMELDYAFRDCYLNGDQTVLYFIARSIMKLQSLYGLIPSIKGKGKCAQRVAEMLVKMRRENFMLGDEQPVIPEIDQLIIIDREVDQVSPICTQLTYEGLIDELFGIKNSLVEVELEASPDDKKGGNSTANATEAGPKLRKVQKHLNSEDKLYSEIRDMYFMNLGPFLNKKAMDIKGTYDEKGNMSQKSTGEMKEFVRKLNIIKEDHRSLEFHTNMAKKIKGTIQDQSFRQRINIEQGLLMGQQDEANEYLETCIDQKECIKKVLRLLCLKSLCNNGIPKKEFEFYSREILQTYGYETILTLMNLEKLGMFKQNEAKGNWKAVKAAFKLINEDIDEENPQDYAYTHCMYAPLSVRLVERACKGLWGDATTKRALQLLPGPTVDIPQEGTVPGPPGSGRRPVTLVFFAGGCTFAEITSLRFLGEMLGQDFVIATTKLINGDSLMDSIMESV